MHKGSTRYSFLCEISKGNSVCQFIKNLYIFFKQGTGRIGHHSDYVEVIPKYLMEIPDKYGVDIDIMIEAKFKELSLFHLYKKYPELNCAVSGEIPKDLFVPKPTVPRSELQKIKKAKKATEKEVGKVDRKKNTAEKKPLKRKINKLKNDEALKERKVESKTKKESKKNAATITKVKSTSVEKKKKKVENKKKSLNKLKYNDEFTSDECSDTSLDSSKSVEVKKLKKGKQKSTSKPNGEKREVSRKSSRKRKDVSYALSDNSDD